MTISTTPKERSAMSLCPLSLYRSSWHRTTITMQAVLGAIVILLGVACCISHTMAQPVGEITPRPAEPELRVLWRFPAPDPDFGVRAGGLGDIYGGGSSAWGVFDDTRSQWLIFRHDSADMMRDTVPVQRLSKEDATWPYPIVGDFWGTGHNAVGFVCDRVDSSGEDVFYSLEIDIHRTDGDSIDQEPAVVAFAPEIGGARVVSIDEVAVADLNHDGSDELIVLLPSGTRYGYRELWIYEGGPHFQTSYPTVLTEVPFTGLGLQLRMAMGDFDGDSHPDIFLGHTDHLVDTINYLAFYWGNGTLFGYEDTANRRIIPITRHEHPAAAAPVAVLDWDGDGVSDLALGEWWVFPPGEGTFLYRSASGRSARTRSYRLEDADLRIKGAAFLTNAGALNDTSTRAPMFAIGLSPQRTALFSHGAGGPDLIYDAHISENYREGLTALPDADGDGWDDLMGRHLYAPPDGEPNSVTIYAGGPYIPRDTATAHVEMIAQGERGDAITAWPNPVCDRLSIAWRGDLLTMPRRFTVHDGRGDQVADRPIPPGAHSVLWECRNMSAGMYLVRLYAADGSLLALTRVIKHDTPSQ